MNFLDNLENLEIMENKILEKFNKAEMESKKLEPLTRLNVPADEEYEFNPTFITYILENKSNDIVYPHFTTDRRRMSCTDVSGVLYFIGGYHEDFYDPGFCIYNDVITIENGIMNIYGYPRKDFPPTDFHKARYVNGYIWIFGNVGYPEDRKQHIQVCRLNINSMKMENLNNNSGPLWNSLEDYPLTFHDDHFKIQDYHFYVSTLTWKSTI